MTYPVHQDMWKLPYFQSPVSPKLAYCNFLEWWPHKKPADAVRRMILQPETADEACKKTGASRPRVIWLWFLLKGYDKKGATWVWDKLSRNLVGTPEAVAALREYVLQGGNRDTLASTHGAKRGEVWTLENHLRKEWKRFLDPPDWRELGVIQTEIREESGF